MLLSVISVSLTQCMDSRKKGFDEKWGDKTCAIKGRRAQLYAAVNWISTREEANQIYKKIAQEMATKGETPESLLQKAKEAAESGKRCDAANYRRVSQILSDMKKDEKK